ncbi:hypothetical protein [Thiocystis violascens]|uniref:Uncharacterized protein n=1 Tax=Thiocystis violascens (strain ATCC 17096 / DSM 198 / 6111) TaxID=765911 RepID=I3YGK2_THIV6|nr:hypothetical protein [Thiocystis violascens]AFL76120.1 hypothetical protein Thivi_4307 [Thiocystis violascens DSM 198]
MLTFDAPSLPSPLAIRECTRPRFDGSLDKLGDWLTDLRAAGIRQSGPALILALEKLRRSEISTSRRLAALSALKVPLLKTCAGLPKPGLAIGKAVSLTSGVTLEQRLDRLMFANLNQMLRQIDRQGCLLSNREYRKRDWTLRNLFRFAKRQMRYAALWNTPLPAKTWLDLHELHVYLLAQRVMPMATIAPSDTGTHWTDPELEYKQLLLFGLAAHLKPSAVRTDVFLEGLPGWATQTLLEDPERMLGRIRLFLVPMLEDEPPRQLAGPLHAAFRGWVLQPPYSFIHQLDGIGYKIAPHRNPFA